MGRCIATQGIVTTASLENAVAKSAADVRQQFPIEKELVSAASKAFEERIVSELTPRVDERIGIVTSRVTELFVAENAEIKLTVQNLEGVLEAIGGERFQQVAAKINAIETVQANRLAVLAQMLAAEAGVLRSEVVKQIEVALGRGVDKVDARGERAAPRFCIPGPSGWKLEA